MDVVKTWLDEEPLLTRVGPVALALVAYLLAKGFVDKDTADLVFAIVGAIAGTGGLLAARGLVTPLVKLGTGDGSESD